MNSISAKVRYPLAHSTLTEKECKSIMFPSIQATLSKSGIASSISIFFFRDGPMEMMMVVVLEFCPLMIIIRQGTTTRTAAILLEHSCARNILWESKLWSVLKRTFLCLTKQGSNIPELGLSLFMDLCHLLLTISWSTFLHSCLHKACWSPKELMMPGEGQLLSYTHNSHAPQLHNLLQINVLLIES